jgi:hypothetical protein
MACIAPVSSTIHLSANSIIRADMGIWRKVKHSPSDKNILAIDQRSANRVVFFTRQNEISSLKENSGGFVHIKILYILFKLSRYFVIRSTSKSHRILQSNTENIVTFQETRLI